MTDVEMKRGKMEKGGKTVKDGNMRTFECDSGSDLCVGTKGWRMNKKWGSR